MDLRIIFSFPLGENKGISALFCRPEAPGSKPKAEAGRGWAISGTRHDQLSPPRIRIARPAGSTGDRPVALDISEAGVIESHYRPGPCKGRDRPRHDQNKDNCHQ